MAQSAKEFAMEIIQGLPENTSLEQIAYRIYFEERMHRADQQIQEGKIVTHEQAKERMKKWLE